MNHELANRVMGAAGNHLAMLAGRWKDEAQYEDWNGYVLSMERVVNAIEGAEFVSLKKRPFAFEWKGTADGIVRETRLHRGCVQTRRRIEALN